MGENTSCLFRFFSRSTTTTEDADKIEVVAASAASRGKRLEAKAKTNKSTEKKCVQV